MPAYNSAKFIAESIQCILDQTYFCLELIIICDKSIDNTIEIAKKFSDERIKILEPEKNQGVSEARNIGLKLAVGRYIAFCDADDYWYTEKLSTQIGLLEKSNLAVCHSNCDLVDLSGVTIGLRRYPEMVTYKMMRHRNYICNSSGLYDTEKLQVILQRKIYHEDYLMWLELLSDAGMSIGSKNPLLKYTINPNGLSSNKLKSLLGAFYIQRLHGLGWFECGVNFFLNIAGRVIELILPLRWR
jgi:teichuronic acid biosynthesis glycosyltransferase TuaG